jgi:hypothetical protein
MYRVIYRRVMHRVLMAALALLLVVACVAVATLAPSPTGGVCANIRVDQAQKEQRANLAGRGEMLQTEKIRCRSTGQRGS